MASGLVLLLIAAGVVVLAAGERQRSTALVVHTYEVERALDKFSILTEQLETARRGYLLHHRQASLDTYRRTTAAIPHQLDRLESLTRDNASQQTRIVGLRAEAKLHLDSAQQTFARLADPNPAMQAMADFAVDSSFVSMVALRNMTSVMETEEKRLLAIRRAAQDKASSDLNIILGVVGFLILGIMGGASWIVLRYTADLNVAQEALRSVNSGLEDAVTARTVELSRANDEIQRFAYIVSHDLRSPLVNIMGFTAELEAAIGPLTGLADRVDHSAPDLMQSDAREALADLPEAIGFIRTSTNKMDRLINAILRLSREGRRTLAPARVDIAGLAESIRDSLQFRLNELKAEIAIAPAMPTIVTDRLALEQILSNLIENATKYLQPGRPGRIVVSARREGQRVIIDVTDNGRGVAIADHERIFELFRRSGVQDQPGEGLGLAHVRALSYRLGGVITCISDLGAGATFRLSLPHALKAELREESPA
ncbi:CHASE3 domain-containing protein [Polymorphobacter megasporae]|nr:CHASE3 domain-containing protein [Polymorphobacter sp. PAMC 29334]UAJ12192.1 CHASE3 domain-containing protein [Polymorphobacter megasporae]